MEITKRTVKYDVWYETTYWRNDSPHIYVTKTLSEHHDFLHARAKAEGLQAITTRYDRTITYIGLYGEQIIITNRGKLVKPK
jgi:hypothetical protein